MGTRLQRGSMLDQRVYNCIADARVVHHAIVSE
jgi:hypothetical protein